MMGRPPLPDSERKVAVANVRFRPADYASLFKQAIRESKAVHAYIRELALEAHYFRLSGHSKDANRANPVTVRCTR